MPGQIKVSAGNDKIWSLIFCLASDRRKFARRQEDYLNLATAHFVRVKSWLRHGLLRVPYFHLIVRCCHQVPAGEGADAAVPGR